MKVNIVVYLFFYFSSFVQGQYLHVLNEDEIQIENNFNIGSSFSSELSNPDPLKNKINPFVLGGVGLATAGGIAAVHFYQANAWWKTQNSIFRIRNDWDYALWIDKVGHFFGTNLLAHGFCTGLNAAGYKSSGAYWVSAAMAFAFETYVEIEDGYGQKWGFSPGDFTFDFLGASYFMLQHYYPYLKNIQIKVSYYPSEEYRSGRHKDGNIIDDYMGQKYWLAFRMNELLPDKVSQYWPDFLQIAAGMGINNMDGSGGGNREFYVALDIDSEALPFTGSGWNFVKNTLNHLHLPMPGFRITPNAAFFALCY